MNETTYTLLDLYTLLEVVSAGTQVKIDDNESKTAVETHSELSDITFQELMRTEVQSITIKRNVIIVKTFTDLEWNKRAETLVFS